MAEQDKPFSPVSKEGVEKARAYLREINGPWFDEFETEATWENLIEKPKQELSELLGGELSGTYLGFAPTNESGVAMGEIEMFVDSQKLAIRMATGLGIETEEIPTELLRLTSHLELMAQLTDPNASVDDIIGIEGLEGYPKIYITKNPYDDGAAVLVYTGGLGNMLSPTVFYTPKQVEAGLFQKAIDTVEQEAGKGIIPRLSNNGKAPKYNKTEEL